MSATLWVEVRDAVPFHGVDGDVWRVSVKPSDAPELVARIGPTDAIYDWGGGLVWLLLPAGSDLRARLGDLSGHATIVRADDETRDALGMFHPEPAPLAAIGAGLRARFDPRGMLNAGLMNTA